MITGRALCFGDDVNTDLLHPSRFYSLNQETVRQGFLGAVEGEHRRSEDAARIVIAGRNFGCGSSRETTMTALKLAGVQGILAEGTGRIFFRNALCLGLPVWIVPGVTGFAETGQRLQVEGDRALNLDRGTELALPPLDPLWAEVLAQGGMMPFLASRGAL